MLKTIAEWCDQKEGISKFSGRKVPKYFRKKKERKYMTQECLELANVRKYIEKHINQISRRNTRVHRDIDPGRKEREREREAKCFG